MSTHQTVTQAYHCHWTGCATEHRYQIEKGFTRLYLPDGWERLPSHWRKHLIAEGQMQPEGWLVCPEHAAAVEKQFS